MKNLLLLSMLLLILSCTKNEDKQDLKAEVEKNENYVAYKTAMKEIILSGLNRDVSFKNANKELIDNELKKVKNVEDLKTLYNRAGVVNGEKLAELQYEYGESLKKLIKDIPELKKLNRQELKQLLQVDTKIEEEDVKKSANKILESHN